MQGSAIGAVEAEEEVMTSTKAFLIVVAILAAILMPGWRTVADADRDEKVKWQLRAMDRESYALEKRVNDLDRRVKALEGRP